MKNLNLVFVILCILVTRSASAELFSVSVEENSASRWQPGAWVTLVTPQGNQLFQFADEFGLAYFGDLPAGTYQLRVNNRGRYYEDKQVIIKDEEPGDVDDEESNYFYRVTFEQAPDDLTYQSWSESLIAGLSDIYAESGVQAPVFYGSESECETANPGWECVAESKIPAPNFHPSYAAPAPVATDAAFVSQSLPPVLVTGQTYTVSVSLKNTGTQTWSGTSFYLSSQPQGSTTWSTSVVRLASGETIAPGATKSFSFPIKAPAVAGTYSFQWKMGSDSAGAFGSATPLTNLAVRNPSPARLISPTSGAVNSAPTLGFQWESVPTAEAYYLYVGTSPGAKNVVDSGEIQGTSLSVAATRLPVNVSLYARIYTKLKGSWYASPDVGFKSTYVQPAILTAPVSGAQLSSASVTFQWKAGGAAQAYYLYVGTSPGLKDVVDTGEISTLSYSSSSLPVNRTLYARIYTKISGGWYSSPDVSFMRMGAKSAFTYPTQGLTNVDLTRTFTWTAVSGAQAYYLYVGTSPGAKNLVDTGEIQTTSYKAVLLPAGQTLYARVYTKLNNYWQYSDVSFTISGSGFLYPTNGDLAVSRSKYFVWSAISNAQAYYLYVGTSPGAKNVIDSGETQANSYGMQAIKAGVLYYATIWTKINGIWKPSTSIQFKAL